MTGGFAAIFDGRQRPLAGGASEHGEVSEALPAGNSDRIVRMLILVALYAIPIVIVTRPLSDNDLWMNLRAGRWIVDHGAVPATDPFSSYGQGKAWVAYSWLFEVMIHGLDRWLGLAGIVLLRVGLCYAILMSLHRLVARREPRFVAASALTGLAFFALLPLLNERTWLFTLLFSTLTLDAILDLRQGKATRGIWLLPPMFALWANLHIQFIYGLFLLALGCVAPLVDRFLGRDPASGRASVAGTRDWWRLLALAGACLAATLLNPYHVRLYAVVVEYAAKSDTYNLVLELLASSFRLPWEWAMPVLVGAAAFALGRRRGASAFDVLLLAVASFCALRARRDVWFAVLAALAVLTTAPHGTGSIEAEFTMTRPRTFQLTGLVIALLAAVLWSRGLSQQHLESEIARTYPAQAAAVVAERGCRGPLFNEYGWGSYLIWRLPEFPVSIDGRADLHGPKRIRRNVETLAGLPGWDADPDLKAAGTVIIQARTALATLLRLDSRFELIHEDPIAVVFVARRGDPEQR